MSGANQKLARLRDAYRSVFSGPEGELVLEDLYKFGYAGRSSVVLGDNGQGTAENEGKRRVVLRIAKFINMSGGEILELALRSDYAEQDQAIDT